MFQYEFFSLKDYVPHRKPKVSRPDCFTDLDDILWIRSSYWAEHCLECGEPLCYETCPHFKPRGDQRCRLFRYGIYDNPHFKDSPYHAELTFRKWGKMESIVSPGAFTPEKAMRIQDEWKTKCREKCVLMHLGTYGLKKFPIEERRKFDSTKYRFAANEDSRNQQDTPSFLLQLYSHEKQPFTLFFDVTDDTDLVFRRGITVYPGYNQHCFDVGSLFPPKGRLRAKFYPADNGEVSLVFLFCEFVQLKPGVHPQVYPSQTTAKPAAKVKCVAWDLDNTVWDGILIESDPDELSLRPGVLDTIRNLDQRGILQVIVSKNNRESVLPVLKRLGIEEYFIYVLANWNAKSGNLKEAANLLNIGIDSFALVDDSPFERNEVQFELPMVRTYDETVTVNGALLKEPPFDVPVTQDSQNRRAMYQTEAQRKTAAETAGGNNLAFLRSCQLRAHLGRPESAEELLRSYELLQRTNQLNLSGRKYEQDEFRSRIESSGHDHLVLKCEDRFGSYGQVAYLEAYPENGTLWITEFAMSCRVARKCVEAALMKELFAHYQENGIRRIRLQGIKTARNGLLTQTFLDAGFTDHSTEEAIDLVCESAENIVNGDIVSIHNSL